jgi:Cof subfamily protein (haloacid dehalogenase superfamily)
MRSLPRLIVSDVDGTLVRHDKSLAEATVAAFARLRANNIAATLISARPPTGIAWIAEKLAIAAPLAAFNGGTLFSRDGTILAAIRLDPALARLALETIEAAGVDIWLFADGRWYARDADNPHVPRERLSAGIDVTLTNDLFALADRADKIVGVSDDSPLLAGVEQRLKDGVRGGATVARSQAYYLDVTALAANKGDGLKALAGAVGVPLAEVAVLGDMSNDLPMFAEAGFSIAMGQAPDNVRAAADAVTLSNEEDGVAVAIDRLLDGGLSLRR